jgi:4-amino-4-deoxy-L-arabinose transferase-like glycosyltransferase
MICSLAFQVVLHFAIPLMPHSLNDPAWYYMFKCWLFDGVWINDEIYPSFQSPVLYYCSLGYPLLLYMAELLSRITGASFSFFILTLQLICYLLSARLLWMVCSRWIGHTATYLTILFYLWYLPFFNYAHFLMSETWFILSMLTVIYTFQRALYSEKKLWLALCFLVAGYAFLVRPVAGVMFPLLAAVFFFGRSAHKSKLNIVLCSLFFFLFPLVQSGFNKVVFSTWKLREGFAWNFWNRVVAEDGYDPLQSRATLKIADKLRTPPFNITNSRWWEITSQLSVNGMQPEEIQKYCMEVCVDGVKKNFGLYLRNTLKNGLWVLPTHQQESILIFKTREEYFLALQTYESKQHAPLLKELYGQSFETNAFEAFFLKAYTAWSIAFQPFAEHWFHVLLFCLVLAGMILFILKIKIKGQREYLLLFVFSLTLCMSVAACAFEVMHFRYYMPSLVLSGMLAAYSLKTLSDIIRQKFRK